MHFVRLLPFAVADGPHNMAADEVLLRTALTGVASLRFYGWSQPTVSLGYFQQARVRLDHAELAELPFVRRPSGGAMLVHHHELTYALALPSGAAWQGRSSWLVRMHQIIATALGALGVESRSHDHDTPSARGGLCFKQFATGDLHVGGTKIAGSAQRRQRRALLQHGAILLAQSAYTPSLPGIAELCDVTLARESVREAVVAALVDAAGWRITPAGWTDEERSAIAELVESKYAHDSWNCRR